MGAASCVFCGASAARSFDQCAKCGAWGSAMPSPRSSPRSSSIRVRLADFAHAPVLRLRCAEPWSAVLGGGLAESSTVIVYGPRGSFKTTRLVQLAASLTAAGSPALFAAVEMGQSAAYLHDVASRAGVRADDVWIARSGQLGELCAEVALAPVPKVAIVDSLSSLSRGADEVRALGALRRALPAASALVVVCHVTKDGRLAGAEDLAHECDTIVRVSPKGLSTEGEKNRYGATRTVEDDLAQRLGASTT